jgi:hypothetical protein
MKVTSTDKLAKTVKSSSREKLQPPMIIQVIKFSLKMLVQDTNIPKIQRG